MAFKISLKNAKQFKNAKIFLKYKGMKYLFSGDATLLVISSLNVLVNQTITISCLFETGQKGVIFQFPDNIYSAQYCSMIENCR